MQTVQSISTLSYFSLPLIAAAMAIFARISAVVFFLPGLGEQVVSLRVRLGAAFAIALIIVPAVFDAAAAPPTISHAALTIAAEAVAGAIIGFSIRITIFAIQTAGAIASQSLSLAQLFGSSIGFQAETPISTFLMVTAIALAVSSGLHFEIIKVLIATYQYMPLGEFPGASETGEWAAERAAYAFAAALSLALPFVALGFIYNMAIGAANRAMPQLMVAFVGMPAVTLAGLMLLALSMPVLLSSWMLMLDDVILTLMAG